MNQQIHNGQLVTGLMEAMLDGERNLTSIPMLVKKIIEERMWEDFYVGRTKQFVHHDSFAHFVAAQPLEGLGVTTALLKRMCADDKGIVDLIDQAEQGKHGGDHTSAASKRKISPLATGKETDRSTRDLRRLRKDFPELHKEVVNGKTTVQAAAIQAGIRTKQISINLQSSVSAARTIIKAGGSEYAMQIIEALKTELQK
jgi:hypothetical protein